MTEISIDPCGHYVLAELLTVENVTSSGLYLGDNAKEQAACEFGVIKAFGPTAFMAEPGCNPKEYPPGDSRYNMAPHEIWGISVGDRVEFQRYQGKRTGVKQVGNLMYIPDTLIIGKVHGDIKLTTADF